MVHGRVPVLAGIIDMGICGSTRPSVLRAMASTALSRPLRSMPWGGPKETERHFRAIREQTDLPLFAYDLPVCVHTKL